jgi:hypothetical protein
MLRHESQIGFGRAYDGHAAALEPAHFAPSAAVKTG